MTLKSQLQRKKTFCILLLLSGSLVISVRLFLSTDLETFSSYRYLYQENSATSQVTGWNTTNNTLAVPYLGVSDHPSKSIWSNILETCPHKHGWLTTECTLSQVKEKVEGCTLSGVSLERLRAGTYLPLDIVNNVRYFVIFIGHQRSGSSIVGMMLDSHPRVLVSNEYNIIHELVRNPSIHQNKSKIFDGVALRSRTMAYRYKHRDSSKGYSLYVPGGYNGAYNGGIDVIGDKTAGRTVGMYMAKSEKFVKVLAKLKNILKIPIKFIQVIRNPFDSITTNYIYNIGGADLRVQLISNKTTTEKIDVVMNQSDFFCQLEWYFSHSYAVESMITKLHLDVIQIHLSDLVFNPNRELNQLCVFLGLNCTKDFITKCENVLFKEPSRSRLKMDWTQEQIDMVMQLNQQVSFLKRYSFTSH